MKEFDYVIIGGGCSGLSLAYELEIYKKLEDKTLAIIEPRDVYKRDKTWSFWRVINHNFEDCVKKEWTYFHLKAPRGIQTNENECFKYPYQTIDSSLFYKKILNKIKQNKNIHFLKNIKEINISNSFIFNSVPNIKKFDDDDKNYWQHFYGIEIETKKNISDYSFGYDFNPNSVELMNFETGRNIEIDHKDSNYSDVNFMYILPFAENKVLIESTWISKGGSNKPLPRYEYQILEQLRRWGIIKNPFLGSDKVVDKTIKNLMEGNENKEFKIKFKERGAIPLFHPTYEKKKNQINIGTAGGMTRISTGYTFMNIQEHSRYIRKNLENIRNVKKFTIRRKYIFFDKIFMKVLDKNIKQIPNFFYNLFSVFTTPVIKFMSGTSNIFEDLIVILQTDKKWLFIKALLGK